MFGSHDFFHVKKKNIGYLLRIGLVFCPQRAFCFPFFHFFTVFLGQGAPFAIFLFFWVELVVFSFFASSVINCQQFHSIGHDLVYELVL